METYGNLLYDFCFYRKGVKSYQDKSMHELAVHQMLRLIYEVAKVIARKDDLYIYQEFYKQ